MATTSSDESCTAPEKFHLSSSNDEDDSVSRLGLNYYKCPLCIKPRKRFYCQDCIRIGDFYSSLDHRTHVTERFSEKQRIYYNIKSKNTKIDEEISYILQRRKVAENLKTTIAQKKNRIQVLKKLISDAQTTITSNNEKKKFITSCNRTLQIRLPKYGDKVRDLGDYVITKSEENKKRRETFSKNEIELRLIVRESIQKLIKYIFPIKKIIGKIDTQNAYEISELERDLAEATRNISSRERLGFGQDSQNDVQHIIVAPYLPGNGDYSDYVDWVINNKDGVPASAGTNSDVVAKPNPAIRISAALTYTAQLIQVLSFYLDVRLPFKTIYSEFCSSMMTEQQLTRRVARLNTNILYLCYTQRVKLSDIHPAHTLDNILQLLDIEKNELGRLGPYDPNDSTISKTLEKQLVEELEYGDETDSEDENNFPHEWENVSHNVLAAAAAGSGAGGTHGDNFNQIHHQQNFNPQATSMAGGLYNSAAASIASMWRGWTTGR